MCTDRICVRLMPEDLENFRTVQQLAELAPASRADSSAVIRHALDVAANVLSYAAAAEAIASRRPGDPNDHRGTTCGHA